MKQIISLTLICICIQGLSQSGFSGNRNEFSKNGADLLYDAGDIAIMRKLVDSLNIRFKSCELNQQYWSCPLTIEYAVTFDTSGFAFSSLQEDLRNNDPIYQILDKYKEHIRSLDSSVILVKRIRYGDDKSFESLIKGNPSDGYNDFNVDKESMNKDLTWSISFPQKGTNPRLIGLVYCSNRFTQQLIPTKYARLIQYVDCMIDTNQQVFLSFANFDDYFSDRKNVIPEEIEDVFNYLSDKDPGIRTIEDLGRQKTIDLVSSLKNDKDFVHLVRNSVDALIKRNYSPAVLERVVETLGLHDKSLLIKRSYRVIGQCSQDESPRLHARDIALLAARANSWDIFLRAHLDIMNDRFERVSDGSYAYKDRKTYLKELEEINLDVIDLMLGLSLRAYNTSINHYNGTIWRLGWALTESKERDKFEQRVLSMIKDAELDEFNRGLLFILYSSYLENLDDIKEANLKIDSMKNSVTEFPATLKKHILLIKKRSVGNYTES